MDHVLDLTPEGLTRLGVEQRGTVLVDFWAPWCAPCRAMGPTFEQVAHEAPGGIAFAKINVDRFPEAAKAFGVTAVPTVVLFADGAEAARSTGQHGAAELRRWPNAAIARPAAAA